MATGSYMTPIYSRSQSEIQGDLHKGIWWHRASNPGLPVWRSGAALFSYTRAFGDGPRNFEPWSSDVDDT
ncbi:hypothetical protein TNCV_4261491 [Trichonephila clavipes]|nr:hypothetical protein TNCV_4261491 [Trichonephila clavipes]